jgi:hypothetical protein
MTKDSEPNGSKQNIYDGNVFTRIQSSLKTIKFSKCYILFFFKRYYIFISEIHIVFIFPYLPGFLSFFSVSFHDLKLPVCYISEPKCTQELQPLLEMGRYTIPEFFLFLKFIPALINIYYIHLSFPIFLTVYSRLAFKKLSSQYRHF